MKFLPHVSWMRVLEECERGAFERALSGLRRHAGGAKRKVLAGSYRVPNICGTADQNPIVI